MPPRDAIRVVEITDLPPAQPNTQGAEFLSLYGVTLVLYQISPHREGAQPAAPPSLAVVCLGQCASIATGPNDEALHNHPLARHGLQPYTIQEVVNSPWLAERSRIHHKDGDPNFLLERGYRHLVFAFKEKLFECLTRSYRQHGTYPSFEEAIRAGTDHARTCRD